MQNTYKNLRELTKLYTKDVNLNEITVEYQQTEDPVLLAVVFCEYFPYTLTQADKYFYLTDSDKSSFAVEELHKAMLDFDINRGNKIQTMYSKYLNNRLRSETQMLNHKKRKCNNGATSYDEYVSNLEGAEEDSFKTIELLDSINRNEELSNNEIKYCELVMQDTIHVKDSDIAKTLGISSAAVNYIKKSLSKKLLTLV